MPAIPAKIATIAVNSSGLEMKSVKGWLCCEKPFGTRSARSIRRSEERGGDRNGKADGQRQERAGDIWALVDERHAEASQRAELGPTTIAPMIKTI